MNVGLSQNKLHCMFMMIKEHGTQNKSEPHCWGSFIILTKMELLAQRMKM